REVADRDRRLDGALGHAVERAREAEDRQRWRPVLEHRPAEPFDAREEGLLPDGGFRPGLVAWGIGAHRRRVLDREDGDRARPPVRRRHGGSGRWGGGGGGGGSQRLATRGMRG